MQTKVNCCINTTNKTQIKFIFYVLLLRSRIGKILVKTLNQKTTVDDNSGYLHVTNDIYEKVHILKKVRSMVQGTTRFMLPRSRFLRMILSVKKRVVPEWTGSYITLRAL